MKKDFGRSGVEQSARRGDVTGNATLTNPGATGNASPGETD